MMTGVSEKYNILERKLAARSGKKSRGKTTKSKKQIIRELEKSSKEFRELRKTLLKLKSEKTKLEKSIEDIEEKFESAKSNVITLNDALKNLALVDSNKVVFYSNDCSDIGYVIDGEEYYVDGKGETTLMKEYRKQQRAKQREQQRMEEESSDCNDCGCGEPDESEAEDQEPNLPEVEEGQDFEPFRFLE